MMNGEKGNPARTEGASAPPPVAPLRRRLKIAMRDALAATLLPVARFTGRKSSFIPILAYHRVLPNFPAGSPRSANVDPRQFADQMHYLVSHDYQLLSLNELRAVVGGDMPAPQRAALVTFDDGYADNYLTAYMIGQEHGIPINFFIPTGIIGLMQWPYIWGPRTPQESWHMEQHPDLWRPLTWDQVRLMRRGGAHFGCHGYLHRRLSQLGPEGLEEEISRSILAFENGLGERARFFSIPWGDSTDYNDQSLRMLRKHGIELIFSTHPCRVRLPHEGDLFPRITIREHDSLEAFARKLQGAHDLMHRLFRRGGEHGA